MEGPREQENTYVPYRYRKDRDGAFEKDERDEALTVEMKKGKEMRQID